MKENRTKQDIKFSVNRNKTPVPDAMQVDKQKDTH